MENTPILNKPSQYNSIKSVYYVGITEAYKPFGTQRNENLYYYDVNSLYPFVAIQDMPRLNCAKLTFIKQDIIIDNFFGFFYWKIEAPSNNYLGLLPVKVNLGI